jgi:hypothetical protein
MQLESERLDPLAQLLGEFGQLGVLFDEDQQL